MQGQPPRPPTRVSGALQARFVPRVSPRVPPKTGVSERVSCPKGCPSGPLGPGSGVSKKCPQSVPDTFLTLRGTLSGHFLDTPEPGAKGLRGHPFTHSLRHPPFSGHPRGHSQDTSGPKGSCSKSGGGGGVAIQKQLIRVKRQAG